MVVFDGGERLQPHALPDVELPLEQLLFFAELGVRRRRHRLAKFRLLQQIEEEQALRILKRPGSFIAITDRSKNTRNGYSGGQVYTHPCALGCACMS